MLNRYLPPELKCLVDYLKGQLIRMAIFFRGLDPAELRTWTAAMIASGERLDLSAVPAPTVDKHSTGGVGDKVSLILAPLVAAAVPPCRSCPAAASATPAARWTSWSRSPAGGPAGQRRDRSVLRTVGCVICAAGAGLAPADRRLYALRDVTGTVESIPLIASSIMSKKIAEGTGALVLDVKVGSGAFMKQTTPRGSWPGPWSSWARPHGVRTSALLTAMDTPLGRAVGNALEVEESVATLRGAGPEDLVEVTLALAREMLALAGIQADPAAALADGRALARYQMIAAQGGDPAAPLPAATHTTVVSAAESGYLRGLDAFAVGVAAWRLGAGRARKEDAVSASAGVVCLAKPGDQVTAGQPVLELRTDEEARFGRALEALEGAISIGPRPPEPRPAVLERIGS